MKNVVVVFMNEKQARKKNEKKQGVIKNLCSCLKVKGSAFLLTLFTY